MEHRIYGNNLQIAELSMSSGEEVYAEAGTLVFMNENIDMEAKARGGFLKSLGRKLMTGESFFVTEFKARKDGAIVAFGGNVPGTIYPLDITPGKDWMAQRDAFLVAQSGVDMSVGFQKRLGSFFFGGEGFILQKFSGKGRTFIHAAGDFVVKDLAKGEHLLVNTGSAVAWESSVNFDIRTVKGIKTMLFSGEGIFITDLEGPGRVIIQSMNIRELALALSPFMAMRGQSSGNLAPLGGILSD
jgi:uncharacterized protein (TIGR00266 family)